MSENRRTTAPKRVGIRALKENKLALGKEGFSIGESFNYFKDTQARSLPQQQVYKKDVFKYVGDIEEDYDQPGKLSQSIRNPSAPPDDYQKMLQLLPRQMWKKSALTGNKRIGDVYTTQKLRRKGDDGRVYYVDDDGDGEVDVGAQMPMKAKSRTIPLSSDQLSYGLLVQSADQKYREDVERFKQPRFDLPGSRESLALIAKNTQTLRDGPRVVVVDEQGVEVSNKGGPRHSDDTTMMNGGEPRYSNENIRHPHRFERDSKAHTDTHGSTKGKIFKRLFASLKDAASINSSAGGGAAGVFKDSKFGNLNLTQFAGLTDQLTQLGRLYNIGTKLDRVTDFDKIDTPAEVLGYADDIASETKRFVNLATNALTSPAVSDPNLSSTGGESNADGGLLDYLVRFSDVGEFKKYGAGKLDDVRRGYDNTMKFANAGLGTVDSWLDYGKNGIAQLETFVDMVPGAENSTLDKINKAMKSLRNVVDQATDVRAKVKTNLDNINKYKQEIESDNSYFGTWFGGKTTTPPSKTDL